ncbi:MAG: ABC transporter substrate-binding protein [Betaproteobacteria bacterium]|nr:ABC transporter substrate-binding protein [Betaproteobacteria bacterium]
MTSPHRPSRLRRRLLQAAAASLGAWGASGAFSSAALAQSATTPSAASTAAWAAIEQRARGQKVFFNAWGGSERTNAYLQWAAGEVNRRFGVQLEHVKLTDTVEAVRRVRSEKAAGRNSSGSVDVVWINGENFLAMKREGLLFGPFAESLPNFQWVDVQGKPTTRIDFSEPVEGMEAPWGMAQFTLYADRQRVPNPPRSMAALLEFARANPGRVTYPRPPAFVGTTFLKQALLELHADRAALYRPVTPEALAQATAPLWRFLDALHPHLWRNGKQFPATPAAIRQMVADGELFIALSFNPNEAANEIAAKRQPETTQAWQMSAGSIGNTHFLAIPFNANAKEGAQVLINFLMSPEAQARKADIAVWGDPTVLAVDRLPAADKARFTSAARPGQVEQPAPVMPEPHGSWVDPIEREWLRRYGG